MRRRSWVIRAVPAAAMSRAPAMAARSSATARDSRRWAPRKAMLTARAFSMMKIRARVRAPAPAISAVRMPLMRVRVMRVRVGLAGAGRGGGGGDEPLADGRGKVAVAPGGGGGGCSVMAALPSRWGPGRAAAGAPWVSGLAAAVGLLAGAALLVRLRLNLKTCNRFLESCGRFLRMERWGFLTNHARVLLCIARDPGARLRDVAASLGITERSAHALIADLTSAGYVVKHKHGRRNSYQIQEHLPLPEPASLEPAIGDVLAILLGDGARQTPTGGPPAAAP